MLSTGNNRQKGDCPVRHFLRNQDVLYIALAAMAHLSVGAGWRACSRLTAASFQSLPITFARLYSTRSPKRASGLQDGPELRDFLASAAMASPAPVSAAQEGDKVPYLREEDIAGHRRKGLRAQSHNSI